MHKIPLDFSFIAAKLNATDVNSLIQDYDYLARYEEKEKARNNRFSHLVQGALRLSADILGYHEDELYSQLYGRLLGVDRGGEYPEIRNS